MLKLDARENWSKVQDLYSKSRDAGMSHIDAVKAVQKMFQGVGPGNQRRLQDGYKPTPKPDPKPAVIKTLDLKRLQRGGGDWNITGVDMKKSKVVSFKGKVAVECVYGKNSGTSKDPGEGGFVFTAKPDGMNNQEIAFSWQVWYPKGFNFVRGGKFGGTFVGTGVASGYRHSPNGASNRVMWQEDGGIIAYVYPSSDLDQKINGLEPEGHGVGFFNAEFASALKTDAWNTIEVGTKMNTFKNGKAQFDGETYVVVNGKKCVQKGINWSSKPSININRFELNSFFGGPLPTPETQTCYFSNFQMKKYEH
ncbi:hypothetical protein ATCVCanal1_806L [Acanthocystis turfacea Chlorella virus Canal-1]|nr:hypothetical protein ATCVCanal1_806L [Acanthocystis turfacea Chlorella virus Canal-1]